MEPPMNTSQTNKDEVLVKDVKCVIFDMGGVIYPNMYDTFIREFFRKKGIPRNIIHQLFDYNDHSTAFAQFERGEMDHPNKVDPILADKCFQLSGIQVDTAGFTNDCINIFLSGKPHSEIIQSIVTLRRKGFKTALLTNNVFCNGGTLQPLDESLFDVVVQSCVERMRKPDPRIYELTLDRLQLRASDVVFLDDNVANVESARKMGIRSILVVEPLEALIELEKIVGLSLRNTDT